MSRLIEFFARQGLFSTLILVYVLVVGSVTAVLIQKEAFPNVAFDVVLVTTAYPGAAPEEVEKLITNPLEQDLKEVNGIKKMTSVSAEGQSIITLQLDPDQVSVDDAKADIKEVIDRFDEIPDDAKDPRVYSLETKQQPIIEIFLSGDMDELELREKARFLEKRLEDIRNVAKVNPRGMRDLEIYVQARPEKLAQLQLSLNDLIAAVKAQNISIPGGSFERVTENGTKQEFLIRTVGEYQTVSDIGATVIRANDLGRAVRIRDVADIKYTLEKVDQSFRGRGKSAINLTVVKKEKADAIDLVNEVKKVVEENRSQLGDGIEISYANDLSYYIKRRLKVLQGNLGIGLVLVLVVLAFFFPFKIAILTAIGIPFSFLGTLIFFNMTGISLNLLTMMGLIIVVGMLVDDAIVVIENAVRYIEKGMKPAEAAIKGTQQIWLPVTAAVLTTLTVFLPLMFMSGIFGKFVKYLPAAVIVGLILSLLECFFILPNHIGNLIKDGDFTGKRVGKKKLYERVDDWWKRSPLRIYKVILEYVIRFRWPVVFGSFVLFVGSITLAVKGMNFVLFPPEGVEVFLIKAQTPVGTSIDETTKIIKPIEEEVARLSDQELDTFISRVGIQQQDPNDPNTKRGSHFAQVVVYLTPETDRDRTAKEIIEYLREKIGKPPGLESIRFDRINPGPPAGAPISIGVRGDEYEDILPAVQALKDIVSKEEGVSDVADSHIIGKKELWVKVNSSEAAAANLTVGDIGTTVRAAYEGVEATQIKKLDEEVAVRVIWPKETRDDGGAISGLKISNRTGNLIPITSVAKFEHSQGIANYEHQDNQRQVRVVGDIDTKVTSSTKVNSLVAEMIPELQKKFPKVKFNFGGENEDTQESMQSLIRTFGVAVLGIFLILVVTFQSLLQAALVLFLTVPLGIIAVIWTFFLHGWPLTFMGMLGVIALAGVIVNNSIVYISFVNESRVEGVSKYQSLLDAGLMRLRPIFLTTFTTVVGILPTAYGVGGLDKFVVPIALALGWGLGIGSLLTTIVFPASVAALDDIIEFGQRIFGSKKGHIDHSLQVMGDFVFFDEVAIQKRHHCIMKRVLLVGYRKNAILAAERLGVGFSILSDKRIPRDFLNHVESYAYNQNLIVDAADIEKWKSLEFDAIIPVTEKAVVPAARLREQLGVEGYNSKEADRLHDKLLMKRQARRKEIPVTEFFEVDSEADYLNAMKILGKNAFLKSRIQSGSRDQIYIDGNLDLESVDFQNRILERPIQGREYSAEVFVKNRDILFFNTTKYIEYHKINLMPAKLELEAQSEIRSFVEKVIRSYDVRTELIHVEFFVTDNGLVLGELAARPPGGYLMDLLQLSYGFDPWEIYIKIHLGLTDQFESIEPKCFSAVIVVHPGEGIVEDLGHISEIEKLKSFVSMNFKVEMGDTLSTRDSAGEDVGHVLLKNPNYAELMADLDVARAIVDQIRVQPITVISK